MSDSFLNSLSLDEFGILLLTSLQIMLWHCEKKFKMLLKKHIFPSDTIDIEILLNVTLFKSCLGVVKTYSLRFLNPHVTGQGVAMYLQCQLVRTSRNGHFQKRSLGWHSDQRRENTGPLLKLHMFGKYTYFP